MKKGGYKTKRLEWDNSTNRKTLEKNPAKGGTPANERRTSDKIFVKTFDWPRSAKENKVRNVRLGNCKQVENSSREVML